jgi:hypothetical protein
MFLKFKHAQAVARVPSASSPAHALYAVQPPRNTLVHVLPSPPLPSIHACRPRVEVHDLTNALKEILLNVAGLEVREVIAHNLNEESNANENPSRPHAPGELVPQPMEFLIRAGENTWSRSARRGKKRKRGGGESSTSKPTMEECSSTPRVRYSPVEITRESGAPLPPTLPMHEVQRDPPALLCTARVLSAMSPPSASLPSSIIPPSSSPGQPTLIPVAPRQLAVQFQWSYGRDADRPLFESFVSHVWRKVLVRFGNEL